MNTRDKQTTEEIEAAIARVLEAERAAQTSIEAAAHQSAVSVAQARERARLILAATDRRIMAVRQAVAARIAGRQAEVRAAIRRLRDDAASAGAEPGRLDRALDAVAAALTSGKQP
jgi:20S proteasome alpha/beta subunit